MAKKPIPKDDDPAFVAGVARMKELFAQFFATHRAKIAAEIVRAYEEHVK